jgi:hypothetical protein
LQGLDQKYEEMLSHMTKLGSSIAQFDWNDWNGSEEVADALVCMASHAGGDLKPISLLDDKAEINRRMDLSNAKVELFF